MLQYNKCLWTIAVHENFPILLLLLSHISILCELYLFFLQSVIFMDNRTYACSIQNPNEPNAPPKNFTFDGVYHTDSTTEAIYNDNGFDLVEVKFRLS